MSKLTDIQEAVAKLASDEIYQLTIWLLTQNLNRAGTPEPFGGTLLIGSLGRRKSVAANKLFGNQS